MNITTNLLSAKKTCSFCPTVHVSTYCANDPSQAKVNLFAKTTLVAKNDSIMMSLAPIHDSLATNAAAIDNSGASNIVIAKLSFMYELKDSLKKKPSFHSLAFPLRIPGTGSFSETSLDVPSAVKKIFQNNPLNESEVSKLSSSKHDEFFKFETLAKRPLFKFRDDKNKIVTRSQTKDKIIKVAEKLDSPVKLIDDSYLFADSKKVKKAAPLEKDPGLDIVYTTVLSTDWVRNRYAEYFKSSVSQNFIYQTLAHYFKVGRSIKNPQDLTHGHTPKYDSPSSFDLQYIHHTEQILVAYLALPEASEMIANRLILSIKNLHVDVEEVKIKSIGLHLHSTKTCCAPCEYSLVGLMQENEAFSFNTADALSPELQKKKLGFRYHLNSALKDKKEKFITSLDAESLNLFTTVSAFEKDSNHGLKTKVIKHDKKSPFTKTIIDLTEKETSQNIYTSVLPRLQKESEYIEETELDDYTVIISGSLQTWGTAKTISRLMQIRILERSLFDSLAITNKWKQVEKEFFKRIKKIKSRLRPLKRLN